MWIRRLTKCVWLQMMNEFYDCDLPFLFSQNWLWMSWHVRKKFKLGIGLITDSVIVNVSFTLKAYLKCCLRNDIWNLKKNLPTWVRGVWSKWKGFMVYPYLTKLSLKVSSPQNVCMFIIEIHSKLLIFLTHIFLLIHVFNSWVCLITNYQLLANSNVTS